MSVAEIESFFILVSKITVAIMIIPIIVAIWQWKYLNKPLKVFLGFIICLIVANLLEQGIIWYVTNYYEKAKPWLEYWDIHDTNFLAILYRLNHFFWLGWFYSLLAPGKYRTWIRGLASFLFVAALINYLFIEGYHGFGKFNPAAAAIFTFGLASFYLWYVYRSQLALPLTKNTYFWLSLALIIPDLASFFLFLVGDFSHEENLAMFITMSIMKNGFMIISWILMAIGFWRARYARFVPLPSAAVE
ncbi:MAG: hypothetical protein R2824_18190 [Saprospiraceae bacterium]